MLRLLSNFTTLNADAEQSCKIPQLYNLQSLAIHWPSATTVQLWVESKYEDNSGKKLKNSG